MRDGQERVRLEAYGETVRTQPNTHTLAREREKSKSLSSMNLWFLGRSHCVFPAIGRIKPSFQEPHLEDEYRVPNEVVWGRGRGSGGRSKAFWDSPVHLPSVLHLLLSILPKQAPSVVVYLQGWERPTQELASSQDTTLGQGRSIFPSLLPPSPSSL